MERTQANYDGGRRGGEHPDRGGERGEKEKGEGGDVEMERLADVR